LAHKFTGKQRDSESGLDNFGARFDSSNIGRFTSPDPGNAGASEDAPQSWNAYSYLENNPTNVTDPDGRETGKTEENRGEENRGGGKPGTDGTFSAISTAGRFEPMPSSLTILLDIFFNP
jgi:RHS repeat-associated protein